MQVYLNNSTTHNQRRRGKFVMKSRSWLVDKYDEVTADAIIDGKKDQQSRRKPGDPMWIMANPDLPNSRDPLKQQVFCGFWYNWGPKNRIDI